MKFKKRLVFVMVLLLLLIPFSVASAGKPLKITDPSGGATVSGVYTVVGGGDGSPVEIAIDGGAWEPVNGDKNWTYDWDTTGTSDGSHTVTVQYTDGSATDSVTVTVSNGGGSSARQPNVGEVLVNEFVAAPQSTQTSEWVELYNTTNEDLDIGEMYIDDIDGGGGAPTQIPAGTTISAGGFYVMTFGSYFNNTGDDVRLLGTDSATVHDSYTYSSASYDLSWCRDPDGGSWKALECDPTQGTTNDPPLPPGTWTPGNLEIHVLNVGQGETQLIIGPTGRTLLIGVYEASWNTNQGAQWVADEIRRITGAEHINYVMPSHWHLDHMGYAGYGGIWSLLEEQGITADVLIDRDGGVWNDTNGDGICDPDTEVVWHNAGTISGTARNWVCWATDPNTIGGQIRELAQIDSTTQIDLGLSDGVTTKIVQVDAEGIVMEDGVTPLQGDHTGDALPPSENDYSITIWINWNKFDYVSGGDSDGEYATSSFGYTYNDVETDLAQRIGQEVEAIWVNHHGSGHSTNANYVNTLNPAVAVYSPGSTNTYGHPDQRILDILYNNGTAQYFTQEGDPSRNYYDSVIVNGNVTITTSDGLSYTVAGDGYTATDPGSGSGGPRTPQMGEVLVNEVLPDNKGRYKNEYVELYNTTAEQLDISGMYVDDIDGGGSAPIQIAANTLLDAGGYYVLEMSTYFNNTGDDVRLLDSDGSTVHDSYTYTSTVQNESWCRLPDGGTWSASTCSPTPGSAN